MIDSKGTRPEPGVIRAAALRGAIGLGLALGTTGFLAVPRSSPARHALIIGIDQYAGPVGAATPLSSGGRAPVGNLTGAVNDAEAMRDVISSRFDVPAANIRLLRNAEATRAGILTAIQRLTATAGPRDIVIFYYAGHGSQRRNSRSSEPSKLDQTIVPADANAGAFDIRDKELARAFGPLVDKGVGLTLIFDSCHSGSVVRGLFVPAPARWAAIDPRDAADGDEPPRPEDRGALVISAAQDYQTAAEAVDDDGVSHGVFTSALLKTLRTVPTDEPAGQVFQRVKAMIQSEGSRQEPVLAGSLERRRLGIFGGQPGKPGRITAALLRVTDTTEVELQGGRALGIRTGAELVQVDPPAGTTPVTLRVSRQTGLSRSTADVVAGNGRSLSPGTLFAVDRWALPDANTLRVWLGPATLSSGDLAALRSELLALEQAREIEWVADPTETTASAARLFTLMLGPAGWELQSPSGQRSSLGSGLSARTVIAEIRKQSNGPTRLFVLVPPTNDFRRRLRLGSGSVNDAVQVTTNPVGAHYLLAGRLGPSGLEYAWIMPNATEGQHNGALPVRSDWVASTAADTFAAARLEESALRIAKVRAWLRLESPADDGRFPYRLALKNAATGVVIDSGTVRRGDGFGLVLRADPARIDPDRLEKRRVYVFAIDGRGTATLLFPRSDVQNRFPLTNADGTAPAEIQLGPRRLFTISPPFGIDTYYLLTSDEAISPDALAWDGVPARGADPSALSMLLRNVGAPTRGADPVTPARWSVERLTIRSVP